MITIPASDPANFRRGDIVSIFGSAGGVEHVRIVSVDGSTITTRPLRWHERWAYAARLWLARERRALRARLRSWRRAVVEKWRQR